MTALKVAGCLALIALGIAMVVFGEYDDSPGGQLIGAVAALAGIAGIIRIWRKASPT